MRKVYSTFVIFITISVLVHINSYSQQTNSSDIFLTTNSGCKVFCQSCEEDMTVSSWNGKCLNGFASGYGTRIIFKDGQPFSTFTGTMLNGKRNGQGTNIWADGEKYVGNWLNDKKNGQGTNIWANGEKYVGNWLNGQLNGQGTYIWADGEKYVGNWLNDKKNGQGKYYYNSSSKWGWAEGVSKDGNFYNAKVYYKDGSLYSTYNKGQEQLSRIALLEKENWELKNRNSVSNSSSSSTTNSNAEMERLNLERPCILKFDRMGKTYPDDFLYDIKKPLKNGEYEKTWMRVTFHDDGTWSADGYINGYHKTKDRAIEIAMKHMGCENWYEQK